jgi:hypothetical protein
MGNLEMRTKRVYYGEIISIALNKIRIRRYTDA